MTVHLYCTNSWSKLVLAAIPPTLLCPGLSSIRVHSRWESHRTPALLLRNRGWVWRQWDDLVLLTPCRRAMVIMLREAELWAADFNVTFSTNRDPKKSKSKLIFMCGHNKRLSLYLDERRGVQGNTSMRSRDFPRAQPEGTPETECWYFPVLPTRVKVQTLSNF